MPDFPTLATGLAKSRWPIRDNHYTIRHEQGYGYQIWITKQGFAMLGIIR